MSISRIKVIVIIVLSFVINTLCIGKIYFYMNKIEIDNMEIVDVTDDGIKVKVKANTRNNKFQCVITGDKKDIKADNKKKECTLMINTGIDYEIQLIDSKGRKSEKESINDYLGYIVDFQFKKNKMFLVPGEKYDLEYKNVLLTSKSIDMEIESTNNDIVKIEDNKIIGVKEGIAKIKTPKSDQEINVTVTNLIHAPKAEGKSKTVIPCNVYNQEQSDLLEEILEWKINEAGYQTRAGAVAAARFLTLEFEYRIPYFYENGRINSTGVHYADGEGRYYHKGLYLTEKKFESLQYKYAGPATWGCPLTNYESLPSYGYTPGKKMPNGLDCSGFVTWALHNGGFDPGDVGAGETPREGQCTDLGHFQYISKDLFRTGKVRTGDLINFFGHIGMIIGIDLNNDQITIAESLPNLGGAIARTYTLDKLVNLFTHVVLMDDYYKEDGNYTIMWPSSEE